MALKPIEQQPLPKSSPAPKTTGKSKSGGSQMNRAGFAWPTKGAGSTVPGRKHR